MQEDERDADEENDLNDNDLDDIYVIIYAPYSLGKESLIQNKREGRKRVAQDSCAHACAQLTA